MIYIHIPYCHRKCTYCAFYSTVTAADKQGYVDALCHELTLRSNEMLTQIQTIYLGGGTPSLLEPAQLAQVVDTLRQHYNTTALQEVTLEANPEDLTAEYLKALHDLDFVNRISIGVQSFSDADLQMLNRRHSAAQSIEAVQNAHDAGFDNISIDLIYGLPGQSTDDWGLNIQQLMQLPVNHLSAYALTVEEGTMLHSQMAQGRLTPADECTVIAQYDMLLRETEAHGLKQYEISNFAKEGYHSRHNSRYWNRTPYLGVGAAAHSFDGQRRRWNIADAEQYVSQVMKHQVYWNSEVLTEKDAYNEYLMTALRTVEGIVKGCLPAARASQLHQAILPYLANGLLVETDTHYRPTHEGLLHADGIASDLFI